MDILKVLKDELRISEFSERIFNEMTAKVSVVIPVYNSELYIEKCLRSIFEQTISSLEVIIVDDGSTDKSREIIANTILDYPKRAKSTKFICHERNQGVAKTRQDGLNIAKGEYIIHCDSDDWVENGYYEELYNEAIKANADMAVGDYITENPEGIAVIKYPDLGLWEEFKKKTFFHLALWNRIIKRQFIIKNNIQFFPDINFSEDFAFIIRCIFYAKKIIKVPTKCYYHYYRLNNNSLTKEIGSIKTQHQSEKCLLLLSEFFRSEGEDPDEILSLMMCKRSVKEHYLEEASVNLKKWRKTFPEATKLVVKEKKLSVPCRIAWWLGQYVNSCFFELYLRFSRYRK